MARKKTSEQGNAGAADVGPEQVIINRAPVLTLWGAVVAERLGHDECTALTLGKCLAGLNAQAKGRMIGMFGAPTAANRAGSSPVKTGLGEDDWVELCGRAVPVRNLSEGVRAVVKDKPIEPEAVEKYLAKSFGDDLMRVREAMAALCRALDEDDLADGAWSLYERFRPTVPRGRSGWGRKGILDLELIRSLADDA